LQAGDGAAEALFVDGEEVEFASAVEEGLGLAESGVAVGVVVTEFAGAGFDAEGKDIVFDGFDAVETPAGVGDLAGELDFAAAFGVEGFEEFGVVGVIGGAVFVGEEDGLAGEAVAEAVEADSGFGFGGGGTG
jgi:hypothetical protein